ncbi:MAG: hypothetical protein U1F98_06525 [Verrucomicrobiota bacterium]
MFAIITPALILGAIAERIKFSSMLLFMGLWMVIVYFPLAHMVWGVNGAMNGVRNAGASIKAIDFAGGTVVHMSSGWSALILCLIWASGWDFRRSRCRRTAWCCVRLAQGCCGWDTVWIYRGQRRGCGRGGGQRVHDDDGGDGGGIVCVRRRNGYPGASRACWAIARGLWPGWW